MKIVTFRRNGGTPEPGVLAGDKVVGLGAAGYSSALDLIERWDASQVSSAVASGISYPLDSVQRLAPIPRPPKVICVGLNYRDHAIESKMELPKSPTIFNKFPQSVIAPGETIILPKNSEKPDYEAEFAVVIGKRGRHVQAEDWKSVVFGYTIVNDVSARDIQLGSSQWLMGKTFDTFCPMGPAIVTADEIADPHALNIKMTVSGEVLQNSNTRELIFKIPELIAYLSSVFTLEPGDIISTGTPAGVGLGFNPPRWLKPGDVCVVEVEGLGALTNPVAAEA